MKKQRKRKVRDSFSTSSKAQAITNRVLIPQRKVRDSNPRYSKPYSGFRVRPVRPLRQLSLSGDKGTSKWAKYKEKTLFSFISERKYLRRSQRYDSLSEKQKKAEENDFSCFFLFAKPWLRIICRGFRLIQSETCDPFCDEKPIRGDHLQFAYAHGIRACWFSFCCGVEMFFS